MKVSASKTALWFLCAFFAREDVPQDADRPSPYRNFGLACHDALEILRQASPASPPDLRIIANARDLTDEQRLLFPGAIKALNTIEAPKLSHSEVAFALDMETGEARTLGHRIGRKYKEHGAREGIDFCGSADLVWMSPAEATRNYVVVYDLKTGFECRVHDHLPQLMSLAAMACRAYGARGAIVGVLHLFNGEVKEDALIVEDYELDAHVARLQARRRETPDAEPNPGNHCRKMYCNAIGACPAAPIEALVPVNRLLVKMRGEIATLEEARARVALLPLLKERVQRYEEECRAFVQKEGGIRLEDGNWWGPNTTATREISATPEAIAILVEELGDEGARQVCRVAISQTSIREALTALGCTPVSSALERVMKALEAAGAISMTPRIEWKFRNKPPFLKKGAA